MAASSSWTPAPRRSTSPCSPSAPTRRWCVWLMAGWTSSMPTRASMPRTPPVARSPTSTVPTKARPGTASRVEFLFNWLEQRAGAVPVLRRWPPCGRWRAEVLGSGPDRRADAPISAGARSAGASPAACVPPDDPGHCPALARAAAGGMFRDCLPPRRAGAGSRPSRAEVDQQARHPSSRLRRTRVRVRRLTPCERSTSARHAAEPSSCTCGPGRGCGAARLRK